MKRALMFASVASMIQQFNMDNIRLLRSLGYEVDVACNMESGSTISDEKIAAMRQEFASKGVNVIHIPIPRNITAVNSIVKSLKQTCDLLNQRQYSLIHCHSPIGGMICRIAHRVCKGYDVRKMIYTAHGFHFYKGAPKKNWLFYYPVEKVCSRWTDVLITINQEDSSLAKRKMKAKETVYVPGVGIDVERFENLLVDWADKRNELEIPQSALLLLSVGELNKNKNHEAVIRTVAMMKDPDIHYAVAGRGSLHDDLQKLAADLGVDRQIHLLGFRSDVAELYQVADIYVHPSFREGLPVSVMEAMASGLPCFVSDVRGNADLIQDGIGGKLIALDQFEAILAEQIKQIKLHPELCSVYGTANRERIRIFSRVAVEKHMEKIYSR